MNMKSFANHLRSTGFALALVVPGQLFGAEPVFPQLAKILFVLPGTDSHQQLSEHPLEAALMEAILDGSMLAEIQTLIDQGADVNIAFNNVYSDVTPLNLAVRQMRIDVMDLLLRSGAKDEGLMSVAIDRNSMDMVHMLEGNGIAVTRGNLFDAIHLSHNQILAYFLGKASLREIVRNDKYSIEVAVRFGDAQTLRLVADTGAKVDSGLYHACYHEKMEAAKILVEEYAADPDYPGTVGTGATALHTCFQQQHQDDFAARVAIGIYLLEKGANPNVFIGGNWTPAHSLVSYWSSARPHTTAIPAIKAGLMALDTAGADFTIKGSRWDMIVPPPGETVLEVLESQTKFAGGLHYPWEKEEYLQAGAELIALVKSLQ